MNEESYWENNEGGSKDAYETESANTSRSSKKKIRRDTYGNPITTVIGSYSKPKNRKNNDDSPGRKGNMSARSGGKKTMGV